MGDLRLDTGWRRHPKAVRLRRRCGAEGLLGLLAIWEHAADHRFDGDLARLDDEAIEIIAEWEGEPGTLVAALVSIGYLDGPHGERIVHDWATHQPWISTKPQRSATAKVAASSRWHRQHSEKVEGCHLCYPPNTDRMPDACPTHTERMPDACGSYAPSPSPSPSPSPTTLSSNVPSDDSHSKYDPRNPWHSEIESMASWFYGQPGRRSRTPAALSRDLDEIRKVLALDMVDTPKPDRVGRLRAALTWGLEDSFWGLQLPTLSGLRHKGQNGQLKWLNLEAAMRRAPRASARNNGQPRYKSVDEALRDSGVPPQAPERV